MAGLYINTTRSKVSNKPTFDLLQFSKEKDNLFKLLVESQYEFLLGHLFLQLLKEMILSWKKDEKLRKYQI